MTDPAAVDKKKTGVIAAREHRLELMRLLPHGYMGCATEPLSLCPPCWELWKFDHPFPTKEGESP